MTSTLKIREAIYEVCEGSPDVYLTSQQFHDRLMWRLTLKWEGRTINLSHTKQTVLLTELRRQLKKKGLLRCTASTPG